MDKPVLMLQTEHFEMLSKLPPPEEQLRLCSAEAFSAVDRLQKRETWMNPSISTVEAAMTWELGQKL